MFDTCKSEGSHVAILLCTFNGAKFLVEQLNSLEAQTHENWRLIVSDDGSTDNTLEILQEYQKQWPDGKMLLRSGPQNGFCENFLSLICDSDIKADYFSLCDQDDVWLTTKLQVGIEYLKNHEQGNNPNVYCGRTAYVRENLKPCGTSPLFVFPRSFRNALVQSIAGGNTMIFNKSAKALLEKAGVVAVPAHDWWIYILVTGAGGDVFYDPKPQVLYRQHKNSLIGGNSSILSRFWRIWMIIRRRFQTWNSLNIAALNQVNGLLSSNNKDILQLFTSLRNAKTKDRFRLIEICGLYRQTRRGTFSLLLATLFKKI